MIRFILLLLVLGFAYYLVYRYRRLDAVKQKQLIKFLAIILISVLLAVLVLTGRLNWLIAAVGALLPLIPRAARFLMGVWPSVKPYFQRYQQNRKSSMHSRFIHLQIDMLSGELQGEVLEGGFAGQKLNALSLERLLLLLDELKPLDSESVSLLVAYLDRMHSGWAKDERGRYEQPASDSVMSERQARDILGVTETADKKEITKAHKRLMQKLHPDRGGSDYLAQQINKARDTLL
ncbi:MAG: molecular chaperone DnaJ [endosymbiont of Galathealinum brachiosum]|uniref:Molecular chaperone DnaJ n=1 Tax=endosymbiont of Galathealinum brachiosum TaxID=2200906 RepID=A0A370DD93_9GAMM|nr:MAG: molecular chaperone DnaJ [endosymbiont of Galathealinum brachiosum]